MSLSIEKLIKLMVKAGFLPRKFFKLYGVCVFIEVAIIKNMEIFYLYIPSKYEFEIKNLPNTYKLEIIKLEENEDKDYLNSEDKEKNYDEIDIDENIEKGAEDKIVDKYKREILLKDFKNKKELFSLTRQLNRFKYSVQVIPYKILIQRQSYISVINRDNSVENFYIKKFNGSEKKQLFILTNLEIFYEYLENIDKLIQNITNVKKDLFKILDKNHLSHSKNLDEIINKQFDMQSLSENILEEKNKLENHIYMFEKLMLNTQDIENKLNKKLEDLNNVRTKDIKYQNINGDIRFSHEKKKLEEEIEKIVNIKQEISKNLISVRILLDDLTLMVDELLFDNIIMFDKIRNNLKILNNFFKK